MEGEEFSVQSAEFRERRADNFPLSACGEAVSWDRDYKELESTLIEATLERTAQQFHSKAQCRVAHTGLKWTKTTNPNGVPQIIAKMLWDWFIVEPRWGSIIWAIGDPACATRRWAPECNAVGVKARCLNRSIGTKDGRICIPKIVILIVISLPFPNSSFLSGAPMPLLKLEIAAVLCEGISGTPH